MITCHFKMWFQLCLLNSFIAIKNKTCSTHQTKRIYGPAQIFYLAFSLWFLILLQPSHFTEEETKAQSSCDLTKVTQLISGES